jgi:predicted NodU family carbamoyl transferase
MNYSYSLSIYGSHDSNVCIMPSQDEYRVYEFERFLKKRNFALNNEPDFRENLIHLRDIIYKEYGTLEWSNCYYSQLSQGQLEELKFVFGFTHMQEVSHHTHGHAAGALWQSPFDEALIISSDGGGHEIGEGVSTFCIYHAKKKDNWIEK